MGKRLKGLKRWRSVVSKIHSQGNKSGIWSGKSRNCVKKRGKEEGHIKAMTAYVPPRTNKWLAHIHKMTNDTLHSMKDKMESCKKVVVVGNFNCGKINWEEFKA